MSEVPIEPIEALLRHEDAVSDWITVDQARIDAFAAATNDHQFIHVDPIRAAETPFGGTIAHGLLTLSLVPAMTYDALPSPPLVRMAVNYGYNRIRFPAPVRVGSRIRGRFRFVALAETVPGRWDRTSEVTVEIDGETRPALVAEMVTAFFV